MDGQNDLTVVVHVFNFNEFLVTSVNVTQLSHHGS